MFPLIFLFFKSFFMLKISSSNLDLIFFSYLNIKENEGRSNAPSVAGALYTELDSMSELPSTFAMLRSGGFLVNIANATSLPKL